MDTKYITLIFSDRNGKPSENFRPQKANTGGFCHNINGYLIPLINYAKRLNRVALLPPPWISFEELHNNNQPIPKNIYWDEYFNLSGISNVSPKIIFNYKENGDLITNKKIGYYSSNTSLSNIDQSCDIIALVNYENPSARMNVYRMLGACRPISFNISDKYKQIVNNLISGLKLNQFATLHIRRTDFLDNHILAPPHGTRPYTSPEFISTFIKEKLPNNLPIIIFTNEPEKSYKQDITKLLRNKNKILFEENLYNYIPENIYKNNYSIYIVLHEIACRAQINVGTTGYVRLGNKYDLTLEKVYKSKLN